MMGIDELRTRLQAGPRYEILDSPAVAKTSSKQSITTRIVFVLQVGLFVASIAFFVMLYKSFAWSAVAACVSAAAVDKRQGSSTSTSVPQYFQTSPMLYPGPTPTGEPAFLAQTNPAPFGTTYIPNSPLETQVPIAGNTKNENIFQLMGQLSHYFPNPDGFGVDEYSLPSGAEIVQLNMLSRHGSRYPTSGSGAYQFGVKHTNYTGKANYTGELSFLNTWTYKLGAEILVPVGKQELFDSGVLHQYMYGHLYPNNGSKIIARSTTQRRMTESAEYFLAGFFGLQWQNNATLELIIEATTGVWNNTLAGYYNCNNSNTYRNLGGTNATNQWASVYLANATARLSALAPGFNWTVTDSYNAQSLCAYETVALGYSAFCGLFTYEEWQGYEYSVDINFAGNNAFQSPTGRAVGIGWVQELIARLTHHTIDRPSGQLNFTLDNMTSSFPLDQSINLDFTHDTNIMGILTAMGFTQFNTLLPTTHIIPHDLIVSHLEPFGARLDIEVIKTPQPLSTSRNGTNLYLTGPPTTYVHFILNQRTIPLYKSFPTCDVRDDGWCELETFIKVQRTMYDMAEYDFSCNGDWPVYPYGTVTDGVPVTDPPSK